MELEMTPDISIITPSYNMLDYLKKCSASIHDQAVSLEHIVVDALSKDGTIDWLKKNEKIISIVEKDNGMYNAINKGIKKARGKYIAYLNCDEQYLPGTLKLVTEYFEMHSEVDVLFGDKLNINPDGSLNSYKKTIKLRKYYVLASNLYVPSCAVFFRNSVFKKGHYFDESFKSCGDAEFLIRLLHNQFNFGHLKKYLATFAISGFNLSQNSSVFSERKEFISKYTQLPPFYLKLFEIIKFIEKLLSGAYCQKFPLEYSIFVNKNLKNRKHFKVYKGSSKTKWS